MADQVTWAEAREVVRRALAAEWSAARGTLYVPRTAARTPPTTWLVAGARESLVDGDGDYDLVVHGRAMILEQTAG